MLGLRGAYQPPHGGVDEVGHHVARAGGDRSPGDEQQPAGAVRVGGEPVADQPQRPRRGAARRRRQVRAGLGRRCRRHDDVPLAGERHLGRLGQVVGRRQVAEQDEARRVRVRVGRASRVRRVRGAG